ncbi:MAG: PQQ-dependent sugar dehydrogenase [Pseudomarimonas sp.]
MKLNAMLISLALLIAQPALAQLPPDLTLVPQASGFTEITAMRAPPAPGSRLWVLEQSGRARILQGSTINATPWLRLCASAAAGCFVPPGGFTSGNERGLLGMAFHPAYASNRQVYINYTNGGGNTVIARVLTSAGNPDLADTTTFTTLLTISQDFSNHNGGDLHFGGDGYLYIGMGDGGSANDPCARSQTLDPAQLCNGVSNDGQVGCPNNSSCGPVGRGPSRALLGKMLRIDVDNTTPAGANRLCADAADGSAPYAIPSDNPFASTTSNCAEVWALGLRNPFRFSFDRETKDMYIGDVGQGAREEVNFESSSSQGGRNYGWRCREGTLSNLTNAPVCDQPSVFDGPIFEYDHGGGRCSIAGGYRYRGPAPSLQGLYFFGDFCEGIIRVATEAEGGGWSQQTWITSGGNIRSFGEDAVGNVYVATTSINPTTSTVFLITGTLPTNTIFSNGFEAP